MLVQRTSQKRVPAVGEPYVAWEVGGHDPAVQVGKLFNCTRVLYSRKRNHDQGADCDARAARHNDAVVDADIVLRISPEP